MKNQGLLKVFQSFEKISEVPSPLRERARVRVISLGICFLTTVDRVLKSLLKSPHGFS